jgi:hypothetical protein
MLRIWARAKQDAKFSREIHEKKPLQGICHESHEKSSNKRLKKSWGKRQNQPLWSLACSIYPQIWFFALFDLFIRVIRGQRAFSCRVRGSKRR